MCYEVMLCIVPCMVFVVSGNGSSGRTVHMPETGISFVSYYSAALQDLDIQLNDKYKNHVTLCRDLRNSCNGHTAPFKVVTLLTTVSSLEEPIIFIL